MKFNTLISKFILIYQNFIKFIFPYLCPACQRDIDRENTICPQCWSEVTFICDPDCKSCGKPLIYSDNFHGYCSYKCFNKKRFITEIKVATLYEGPITSIIHKFKYLDQIRYVTFLSTLLIYAYKRINCHIDLIVPVPLHKNRLKSRKYNQASLLAKSISSYSKIEVSYNTLIKSKDTKTQNSLLEEARLKNLNDAFSINPNNIQKIVRKNILLIDDVITTGATLNECAKTLKEGGANKVFAIAISRT